MPVPQISGDQGMAPPKPPTTNKKETKVDPGFGGGADSQAAGGGGGGADSGGGGGTGGSGGSGHSTVVPPPAATQVAGPFGSHYQPGIGFAGGPTGQQQMENSFGDPNRLQGALGFWQSPGVQWATQHGYDPGQRFAGQDVTGALIRNNPMVQAAQQDFNMNVLPGIQDQFNTMGLGRSTAAGNAMAKAQAGMMLPLYQEAAQLENERIGRQTQAGQFSAGLGQQELNRGQAGVESELGRRERSAQEQQQGQQWLADYMAGQAGRQFQQGAQGGQQIFDMGGQARDYGQQANQAAYQDFLRRQGLSEEAINPFGGIQGLLGTMTSGK